MSPSGDSVRRAGRVASGQPVPALDPALHACFLDVDGTLLEMADIPDKVRVDDGVPRTLARLAARVDGALALVSGRRISDLDRLFAPHRFAAAGQHGLERRSTGGVVYWHGPRASEIPHMLEQTRAWVADRPALYVEDKTGTFALHYRRAPEMAEDVRAFLQTLIERRTGDYCLQPGKMVVEVLPERRNKGTAVAEFMGESPFAGRKPVFIGDDLSDEPAFSLVNSLGGLSIKVGTGESAARWRLPDVSAVHDWMVGRSVRRRRSERDA